MNQILDFVIKRGQEASTYNGFALLLGGLGIHTNDAIFQAVSHTLAAVCALAGVIISEKAKHANPAPAASDTKQPSSN